MNIQACSEQSRLRMTDSKDVPVDVPLRTEMRILAVAYMVSIATRFDMLGLQRTLQRSTNV